MINPLVIYLVYSLGSVCFLAGSVMAIINLVVQK